MHHYLENFLIKKLDDPFAEVGSDIDLETGDALGGDGGEGGGDGGGNIKSSKTFLETRL